MREGLNGIMEKKRCFFLCECERRLKMVGKIKKRGSHTMEIFPSFSAAKEKERKKKTHNIYTDKQTNMCCCIVGVFSSSFFLAFDAAEDDKHLHLA